MSDIEGAEVSFLVNDAIVLQQCRQMFIELHDTKYKDRNYSVADLVTLIEQNGFKKIENDGPVYYFERKTAG